MSYNNYNRGYAEPTMTSADYMTRTYRWMALGLLVTFAAAFVTATTPLFYVVNSLYLLFTIAELALVFMLLTAYDTQKLSQMYSYYAGDSELAEKASIYGALTLYLDFINIFLYVVRLLGLNSRRRD